MKNDSKIRIVRKILSLTKRILFLPADFASLFILFFVSVYYYITCRISNVFSHNVSNSSSILHLSGAASINEVLKKFGTLDFLFNYDGNAAEELFDRNILFWFPSNNNLKLIFDRWIIFEGKSFLFHIASVALFLVKCLKIIKKYNVLVIRCWDPYFSGLWGVFLSYVTNCPFCISIHADYEKSEKLQANVIPRVLGSTRIARIVEKYVYESADLVFPIRESMVSNLIKKGCREDKIRVFPHGIDLSAFRCKNFDTGILKKLHLNSEKKIISMTGRFEKENYIYDYIGIAEKLINLRKDWILVLIGDGKEYQNITKAIKTKKLDNFVLTPGFISNKEVVDIRMNSYISLCLMGGFSLIEACAAGRPVIAYDVEWHYELVKDNKTGFLIEEGDTGSVAEKVSYLLDNPEIAGKMGENARSLAFERHSIEKTSEIKMKCYKELLSKYA